MRRKPLTITVALVALALTLASGAVASNGGFSPVNPDSPNADGITESWWLISVFIGVIFVIVEGALLVFIIRFRRRNRPRDESGPQIHGSTRLELLWTVLPVLILVAIGSFIFYKLPGIKDVPSANAAGGRLDVSVRGYQFYWQFEYPNGVISIDELRAPVGKPVKLIVTAPDWDVIHSWWIPSLGGKIDAIPGKTNETWFKAESAGRFKGQCAELCGIQHAAMLADVVAMPPDEFDQWLSDRETAQAEGTAELGEETYVGVCSKCHGLSGEGGIGPKIAGSSTLQDRDALEQLVREGRNRMPSVGRDWKDEQIDSLVEYLKREPFSSGS